MGFEKDYRVLFGRNSVHMAILKGRVQEVYALSDPDSEGKKLISLARSKKIRVESLGRHELFDFCQSRQHQGFAARADLLGNASLNRIFKEKQKPLRVVMLSKIQDPGNLGAVIRNCEHAGFDLLVAGSDSSCSVQLGSVAKASAGAVEILPILSSSKPEMVLDEMREKGFSLYGFDGSGETPLWDFIPAQKDLCFVFGAEGEGLSGKIARRLDGLIRIEKKGSMESLNLSSSVAIATWKISMG